MISCTTKCQRCFLKTPKFALEFVIMYEVGVHRNLAPGHEHGLPAKLLRSVVLARMRNRPLVSPIRHGRWKLSSREPRKFLLDKVRLDCFQYEMSLRNLCRSIALPFWLFVGILISTLFHENVFVLYFLFRLRLKIWQRNFWSSTSSLTWFKYEKEDLAARASVTLGLVLKRGRLLGAASHSPSPGSEGLYGSS